jgi:hypothetical protein
MVNVYLSLMRMLLISLIVLSSMAVKAQEDKPMAYDTLNIAPGTLRVIAEVKSADERMVVLQIDSLIGYGQGVLTVLNAGDEVTARLPGQNKPEVSSKINVDLREKMDVGALPSSYILLHYKTVE